MPIKERQNKSERDKIKSNQAQDVDELKPRVKRSKSPRGADELEGRAGRAAGRKPPASSASSAARMRASKANKSK